jgi:predicted HicB family RNase H-like nuclease
MAMSAKKIAVPKKEPRAMPMSFRITHSLKTALESAAAAERRSVSQLIELELEAAMKAKGFLK